MSEMIDRIARIIDFAPFASLAILDGTERSARQVRAYQKAREVVGMLMMPTEAMVEAGAEWAPTFDPEDEKDCARSIWQAMLTAALEDGPDGERG